MSLFVPSVHQIFLMPPQESPMLFQKTKPDLSLVVVKFCHTMASASITSLRSRCAEDFRATDLELSRLRKE
jgi:hypothetical protein